MVQRQQPVCFTVIASARPSSSESPRARTFFFFKMHPFFDVWKAISLSLSLSSFKEHRSSFVLSVNFINIAACGI